ncbi:MAG: hypothetical protein ABSE55_10695 [Terracidiphilus sp.]|jgi:hypothetical protein
MALWKPNTDKIGPNEHIGRRLFDKPQLIGALDQKPGHRLRLEHFLEKRGDCETSLDRMGQSNIDKRVRNYVGQRAVKAAGDFKEPKQFNGWRVIHFKFLRQPPHGGSPFSVVPSPIDGTDLDENIYHAHALWEGRDYYDMATQLFCLFIEHGITEPYRHELSYHERWMFVRARLLGWLQRSSRE